MLKINSQGEKLIELFYIKSNMIKDIENGSFQGTMYYDSYIDTLQDLLGWLLITYDVLSLDILYEWELMQLTDNVYGFKYDDIIKALKQIVKEGQ